MSDVRVSERKEDMSPRGRLAIIRQPDGDVVVHVIPDPEAQWHASHSVEFCTAFGGGGRSPKTLAALHRLAEAIDKENASSPINGPEPPYPKWHRDGSISCSHEARVRFEFPGGNHVVIESNEKDGVVVLGSSGPLSIHVTEEVLAVEVRLK